MKHKPRQPSLRQIFETQIEYLAITLRPRTALGYHTSIDNFLRYLATRYPQIHKLEQLRRDPHLLGWIHYLAARDPALSKATRTAYMLHVRRLLNDLSCSGKYALQQGLIVHTDFPRLDHYLPKPLSPEDDQLLQQQLRAQDNLTSNALLLLRHTGMRIGELTRMPTDSLRHVGGEQWALHVPLGKLHTERWVPADEQIRRLYSRLLLLRQQRDLATRCNLLLPYRGEHQAAYYALSRALAKTAQQAGCSRRVTPHQLRHTYASDMLRGGASLPALMHLLGHHNITMTMRYVQVTQNDLQREYHNARQHMTTRHAIPDLRSTLPATESNADLPGIITIITSLTAVHHLVDMFRRQLSGEQPRRKVARLANRLVKVAAEFRHLIHTSK